MSVSLYVSNLPYEVEAAELESLFGGFGDVRKVTIPTDRETGRPHGIAFIEMADDVGARAAIEAVNQTRVGSRVVRVSRARSQR